jgi:integrase/recombinase XerD
MNTNVNIKYTNTEIITAKSETDLSLYQRFFVAKKVEGVTDRTLAAYKASIDYLLMMVNKPIAAITADDIRIIIARKQISGEWSAVTCNNNRRNWSSFFNWLEDEEFITRSPMRKIKQIKEPKIIKKPFTEDELERLREACLDTRTKAIVEVLFSTGMRVGEIATLTLSNVDMESRECLVMGKGQKERIVYLNTKAIRCLKKYLAERPPAKNDYVFVQKQSPYARLELGRIGEIIRDLGRRANIAKVHPHRLRRTTATMAIDRGVPIEQVQLMLGHEQIATTTMYAIASRKNLKALHERLMV